MKIKLLLLTFCGFMLLVSCSSSERVTGGKMFQKRKYVKGYHVNLSKSKSVKKVLFDDAMTKTVKGNAKALIKLTRADSNSELVNNNIDVVTKDEQVFSSKLKTPTFNKTKLVNVNSKQSSEIIVKSEKAESRENAINQEQDRKEMRTNAFAVVAFIFGILGFFVLGIPFGILAIIFGIIAAGQIKAGAYSGRGLAFAAKLLGLIDIIGALIVMNQLQ